MQLIVVRRLRIVLLAASCGIGSTVLAANRCVDTKGKVTYQDVACATEVSASAVDTSEAFSTRPRTAPAAMADAGGESYTNAHGAWRGPAQFQLTKGGVRDGAAQAIAPMVINLQSNGEVVGVIPAAGCQMSGLASQFVAEYMASIDVSLKGCKDTRFNARFSGHLTAVRSAKEARLTLTSMQFLPPSNKAQIETIEAVLKR